MDRPLNLVDPDGEMPLMLVGCIMGAVSGLIGSLQGQGEIMQRCNAGTDWWDVFGDTVLGAAAGCVTGWFWTPVTSVFEQLVQMIAINFITYQDTQSDFHNCPCDQFGGATNPLG